jgi:hypothetical protein
VKTSFLSNLYLLTTTHEPPFFSLVVVDPTPQNRCAHAADEKNNVISDTFQIWYPCGSFKGDERSAALAKSYSEGGMLSGISKKQLDGGIAGSLYRDVAKLKETVCRAYPQLRKARDELEFGYKLAFQGLPEDKAKEVVPVEPKEQKGVFDGIRNIFS